VSSNYGTQWMRRTKASLIYKKTGNLFTSKTRHRDARRHAAGSKLVEIPGVGHSAPWE